MAVSEIVQRLAGLTYVKTHQQLSIEDLQSILDKMTAIIEHRDSDDAIIKEAEDVSQLIKMVAAVRQQVVKSPKGR